MQPHIMQLLQNLILLCISAFLSLTSVQAETESLAPGYGKLSFELPQAGSYTLPDIGVAGNGDILTASGQSVQLHDLMGDKVVLLSFIYSTCSDVNGCPLATAVLHQIKNRLRKRPEIAQKLRLLTLSFNPQHDTPEQMAEYGQSLQGKNIDWRFLTTASEQQLQPILNQYQQSVQKVYTAEGEFTGTFSHILRVYLIDTDKRIRNIYTVSYLHADTLLNDIQTLLMEPLVSSTASISQDNPALYQAGDNKNQYESKDYQTHSIALSQRVGQAMDLLSHALNPPLGLPPLPERIQSELSAEKIQLGRQLFYDRRLSHNNTISCAMCHIPEQGFTNNELATAVGMEGRTVPRNSPTLYNVAYSEHLFHDGRENRLEQQIWGPLLAANEMANPSVATVLDKIKQQPEYQQAFQNAFKQEPNLLNVGQALASYQSTLLAADSAFDRWYYGQQKQAMSDEAKQGFKLFTGAARCSQCHLIGSDSALLTDQQFHNTGIGYQQTMQAGQTTQKVQLAPGVFVEVKRDKLQSLTAPAPNDLGRYAVTLNPDHRWQYKTPTLRNIALTAPYMHDGSLSTLMDVVEFYNQGGVANELLSPLIQPLHLTDRQKQQLVAFLNALTGSAVPDLVADAYAAPVRDSQ